MLLVVTHVNDPIDACHPETEIWQALGASGPLPTFYLDNPMHAWKKMQGEGKLGDSRVQAALAERFKKCQAATDAIVQYIAGLDPYYTPAFAEQASARETAERAMTSYLRNLQALKEKSAKIEEATRRIAQYAQDATQFQNFENALESERIVQVPTAEHNTVCNMPNCVSNCHEKCQLPFGASELTACHAMNKTPNCTVCGHEVKNHFHAKYLNKLQKERVNDSKMEAEFKAAQSKEEREAVLMKKLQAERDGVEQESQENLAKIKAALVDFHRVATIPSYRQFLKAKLALVEQTNETRADPALSQMIDDLNKLLQEVADLDRPLAAKTEAKNDDGRDKSDADSQ